MPATSGILGKMPSAQSDSTDPLRLLRQQVILAQVRIMELEDERDEVQARLKEVEALLADAQNLADIQHDKATHLETVRADLQTQFEHMRHMQHVTNEALQEVRGMLLVAEQNLAEGTRRQQDLQSQLAYVNRQFEQRTQDLASASAESATRLHRIDELAAERLALKSSRSWRWTAWLRSLERALGRRP